MKRGMNATVSDLVERFLKPAPARAEPATSPQEASRIAAILAEEVAEVLRRDPYWADSVAQQTQLALPSGYGYFGDRILHHHSEKRFLADAFLPGLVDRIEAHLRKGLKVFLVIDSGTTLYWMFNKLGTLIRNRITGSSRELFRNLTIVTNNLPGMGCLMAWAGMNPETAAGRETPLTEIVDCYLLPGKVLLAYSALTGPRTEAALRELHSSVASDKAVFIGLVTGNWVLMHSLRHEEPVPIPLARGEGHGDFKKQLIDVCDEVYVISPLGKIIPHTTSIEGFNNALGGNSSGPAGNPYQLVHVDEARRPALRLVSTLRKSNQLLASHCSLLKAALGNWTTDKPSDLAREFSDVPHFMAAFSALATSTPDKQRSVEFPHERTRENAHFMSLFSVNIS